VVLAKRTGLLGNNIKPTRVSVQRWWDPVRQEITISYQIVDQ
jgi:hypothetical protein